MGRLAKHMIIAALAVWSLAAPASSQELGVQVAPILTIDADRVFASTVAGQQISEGIKTMVAELSAENRKIEAELAAEEQQLTDTRATMSAANFLPLADTFDQKVQRIRAEQDAKERQLQQLQEAEMQQFLTLVTPVLSRLGNKYGAVAILDRRNVLLAADGIDITDEAIARINEAIAQREAGPLAPQNAPQDAVPDDTELTPAPQD